MPEEMRTCRNCRWGRSHLSWCDWARKSSRFKESKCPSWRPRRWVIVAWCALVPIALVIALCIICGVIDQSKLDATRLMNRIWPPQRASDFVFVERIQVRRSSSLADWRVGRVVTWTIYDNGGYAITRGE